MPTRALKTEIRPGNWPGPTTNRVSFSSSLLLYEGVGFLFGYGHILRAGFWV